LLESDAAAEVAAQALPESLAQLNALHTQLKASVGDAEAFFVLNEQFHLLLLELANNRWRLQMVTDLRKVMKLNRHHSLFKEGRLADSLKEHQALMDALNQADAPAARKRMQAHFANGLKAAG
jgi:DNA-binding GntR family transcriptional regulator